MFLSVIVPCYNNEHDIAALMQRITAQMAADCELIVINDGSKDQTGAAIQAFIDSYPGPASIVFKDTANAGAARTRERGLHMAQGEFVYFCDSDDVMQPAFVQALRQQAIAHPEMDVLYFSSDMACENADGLLIRRGPKVRFERTYVFGRGAELLRLNLPRYMYTAAVWTYVARRALFLASGASFTARIAHEDHLITLGVIMSARQIVAIPDVLYIQKVRDGSLTNSAKQVSYLTDRISAFNEAHAFLEQVSPESCPLYDRWSFDSVMGIVRDNPELRPEILKTRLGYRYLLGHLRLLIVYLAGNRLGRFRRAGG